MGFNKIRRPLLTPSGPAASESAVTAIASDLTLAEADIAAAETDIIALEANPVPLNFSATEQDTGQTYLAGEAIFEKTLAFANGPNNSTVSVAHGITGLGRVVDVQGFMDNGTLQRSINNLETTTLTAQARWAVDDTNILLVSGTGGDYSGYDGFVKIRYLKTA